MAARSSPGKPLVIVESPAKAKTIAGILGSDYVVESSIGHIRDLPRNAADVPEEHRGKPWARLGVDVDAGFRPYYIVAKEKKAQVAKLKALLKDASELFLATDEDREGESIAWHLLEVLQPKAGLPVRRMVFHEITRQAIERAVRDFREIDRDMVNAQEARRILDRLYGYEVSPVLWKKIMPGLSAGRVQSVATRLIVERERARMAFRSASYWDLKGVFAVTGEVLAAAQRDRSPTTFTATLTSLDGRRLATGRDFGSTGALSGTAPNTNNRGNSNTTANDDVAGVVHLDEGSAVALAQRLDNATFSIRSVEERPYRRSPYAPFMTSTLQQEAGRKLRFSSQRTMSIAQRLYESGYITYMRTDSTTLSDTALNAARTQVVELYGNDYLPPQPRRYDKKVKNAQEAHEAIRPAGDSFRTPDQVARELANDEFRLYELIWKRTVASQMADARGVSVQVRLGAASSIGEDVEFSASGKVITFPGFLRAYVEGADDPEAELEDQEVRLPPVAPGDALDAHSIDPEGHTTQPPARYTEASLVRALEELGVGRPSTYASIIATIQSRNYVWKKGAALVPSFTAFAVIGLLERHFGDLVDYEFTAHMEDDLDAIASGQQEPIPWLSKFYFGSSGDQPGWEDGLALKKLVSERLGDIDAADINTIPLGVDDDGQEVVVRPGRFGPYVKRGAETASVSDDIAPDELTVAKVLELLSAPRDIRPLGVDPTTGLTVYAKPGRFGPYVQLGGVEEPTIAVDPAADEALDVDELVEVDELVAVGAILEVAPAKKAAGRGKKKAEVAKPKTASLFRDMTLDTLTLEDALMLLQLPRTVGVDPATNEEIVAINGRFGPFLKKGTDSRSIEGESRLLTISLAEALEVFAQPKLRRGQQRAAAGPLRELGDGGTGQPIVIKDGRFGPYVTDGTTNASLRRGDEVETLTIDRALELLAERRLRDELSPPKAAKRGAKKAGAKKAAGEAPVKSAATKKTAAKRSAPKKSGTKKSGAKKAGVKKAGPASSTPTTPD